jgi:hypothetical protein
MLVVYIFGYSLEVLVCLGLSDHTSDSRCEWYDAIIGAIRRHHRYDTMQPSAMQYDAIMGTMRSSMRGNQHQQIINKSCFQHQQIICLVLKTLTSYFNINRSWIQHQQLINSSSRDHRVIIKQIINRSYARRGFGTSTIGIIKGSSSDHQQIMCQTWIWTSRESHLVQSSTHLTSGEDLVNIWWTSCEHLVNIL